MSTLFRCLWLQTWWLVYIYLDIGQGYRVHALLRFSCCDLWVETSTYAIVWTVRVILCVPHIELQTDVFNMYTAPVAVWSLGGDWHVCNHCVQWCCMYHIFTVILYVSHIQLQRDTFNMHTTAVVVCSCPRRYRAQWITQILWGV